MCRLFTVLSKVTEKFTERVGRSGGRCEPGPFRRIPGGDGSLTGAMAGLPELDVARVRRWCERRVPERALHQVRVECEPAPRHLTIVERRAPWSPEAGPEWTSLPIARLRYTQATGEWTLYWRDRNLRFHRYDQLPPSEDLSSLLAEIDRDPAAIFWG